MAVSTGEPIEGGASPPVKPPGALGVTPRVEGSPGKGMVIDLPSTLADSDSDGEENEEVGALRPLDRQVNTRTPYNMLGLSEYLAHAKALEGVKVPHAAQHQCLTDAPRVSLKVDLKTMHAGTGPEDEDCSPECLLCLLLLLDCQHGQVHTLCAGHMLDPGAKRLECNLIMCQ